MSVADPVMDATMFELERVTADGLVATGAQMWVSYRGAQVLDVATGSDSLTGPMTPLHVSNHYCLLKPFVALAAIKACETAGLDPMETRMTELVGAEVGGTLADLVPYRTGLAHPTAMEFRMCRPSGRPALLDAAIAQRTGGPAYSEVAAGWLLSRAIRRLTSEDPAQFCEMMVAGLGASVAFGPQGVAERQAKSPWACPVAGLPHDPMPLLSELTTAMIENDLSPSFGGTCSIGDAGRALEATRAHLAGERLYETLPSPGLLRSMVDDLTPPFQDEIADNRLSIRGGFLSGDSGAFVDWMGADALGFKGGIAASVMVTDPTTALTVSIYLNGASLGDPLARIELDVLMNAAAADLGIVRES